MEIRPLSIGGMPEALTRWIQTKDPASALNVLQQISATYRQDFEKYARKTQVKYLEQLFRQIPHYLIQRGEKILPIEVKSGHGNTLRSLHIFLETHPKSTLAIRFSSLNYSIMNKLDSRPLYAAASLAHESQKEALTSLIT